MSGEMQPTSIIAFASQVSSSVPVWKAEAKTVPARHQHEISNSLYFHLKQGNWKKENIETVSNSLQEAIFRWLFALVSVILLGENLFFCVQRSELQTSSWTSSKRPWTSMMSSSVAKRRRNWLRRTTALQQPLGATGEPRGTWINNGIIWRVVGLGLLTEMEIRRLMKGWWREPKF